MILCTKVDEPSVEGLEDVERFYMVLEPKQKDEHLYRHYPKDLQKKFGEHKWIPADPPSFLNYEGAQILLIGAESDVSDELGINLHPQNEKDALDALLNDLHLELSQHPMAPLLKGQWQ